MADYITHTFSRAKNSKNCKDYIDEHLSGNCSVFRGKSQISQLREILIKNIYEALNKVAGVAKGQGKTAGYAISWADLDGKWSVSKKEPAKLVAS